MQLFWWKKTSGCKEYLRSNIQNTTQHDTQGNYINRSIFYHCLDSKRQMGECDFPWNEQTNKQNITFHILFLGWDGPFPFSRGHFTFRKEHLAFFKYWMIWLLWTSVVRMRTEDKLVWACNPLNGYTPSYYHSLTGKIRVFFVPDWRWQSDFSPSEGNCYNSYVTYLSQMEKKFTLIKKEGWGGCKQRVLEALPPLLSSCSLHYVKLALNQHREAVTISGA